MKILITLFVLLGLFSCNEKGVHINKSPFFEGTIEYEIKYESLIDSVSNFEIGKNRPNRMVCIFKEGDYKKDFYIDNILLESIYYDSDKNLNYFDRFNSDTILFFSTAKEDMIVDTITFQKNRDQVLGFRADVAISQFHGKEETIYRNESIRIEYFLSRDHRVSQSWFFGFSEGGFDRIMMKFPGIILKSITNNGSTLKEQTVVKITNEKVTIPSVPNKIMIEI